MHQRTTRARAPLPETTQAGSTRSQPGARLHRLTALRALAAAGVFAYHLGYNLGFGPGVRWFADGYAGVAFFFVLSGFVLTWSADPTVRARGFYRRRVARIYPSYVVANLAAWVLLSPYVTASIVAAVFFGVQAWWTPDLATTVTHAYGLDAPSWSLSCEAAFYLATPLLLRSIHRHPLRRSVAVVAVYVALAQAAVVLVPLLTSSQNWRLVLYVNPIVRGSEFVLGALTAHAMRGGWRPRITFAPATAAFVAGYALLHATHPAAPVADAVLLPSFWLLVVAAARADLAGTRSWLTTRPMVYAGEVSFAFYLVQFIAFGKLHEARPDLPPLTASAWSAVIAVIAAVALHHLVERPAQRVIMGRAFARRRGSFGSRSMP